MSAIGVAALSGGLALIVGVLVGAALMRVASRRAAADPDDARESSIREPSIRESSTREPEHGLSALVLERAPLAVLALDPSEDVLLANRRAHELGLLDRLGVVDGLREVARLGRTGGKTTKEISLPTTWVMSMSDWVRASRSS